MFSRCKPSDVLLILGRCSVVSKLTGIAIKENCSLAWIRYRNCSELRINSVNFLTSKFEVASCACSRFSMADDQTPAKIGQEIANDNGENIQDTNSSTEVQPLIGLQSKQELPEKGSDCCLDDTAVNHNMTPVNQSCVIQSAQSSGGTLVCDNNESSIELLDPSSLHSSSNSVTNRSIKRSDEPHMNPDATSTPKEKKKKKKLRPGKKERQEMRKRIMKDTAPIDEGNIAEETPIKQPKIEESSTKNAIEEVTGMKQWDASEPADIDRNNQSSTKKRLSRKEKKKFKKDLHKESGEESTEIKERPKKITPNYFLAVRVSNPSIHTAAKVIQDSIVNHNKQLEPAIIPTGTLHITLMVMHLDPDQVDKAIAALASSRTELAPYMQDNSPTMTFDGLGHFKHEVLFAKIKEEEEVKTLKEIAEVLKTNFGKEGIVSTDDRPLSPHLTLVKLSRMKLKRKKVIKKIPEECYQPWMETDFGPEPVKKIFLCSMIHAKEQDGFYHCKSCLDFSGDGPPFSSDDTSQEANGSSIPSINEAHQGNGLGSENSKFNELAENTCDGTSQNSDASSDTSKNEDLNMEDGLEIENREPKENTKGTSNELDTLLKEGSPMQQSDFPRQKQDAPISISNELENCVEIDDLDTFVHVAEIQQNNLALDITEQEESSCEEVATCEKVIPEIPTCYHHNLFDEGQMYVDDSEKESGAADDSKNRAQFEHDREDQAACDGCETSNPGPFVNHALKQGAADNNECVKDNQCNTDKCCSKGSSETPMLSPLEINSVPKLTANFEFPEEPDAILEDSEVNLDDFVIVNFTDEGVLIIAENSGKQSKELSKKNKRRIKCVLF